ncbi:MAG TPA: KpsF/GutQ family sugar-phosphate isomerase [Abditibacteriaceae bacterium]
MSTPNSHNAEKRNTTMLDEARLVFSLESEAIARLSERLDENFERAVQRVLDCKGRVVVTGVGKSGAIGRKIASTFASTGTPALFLHAAEGLHGDLGMVAPGDVLLAISYSGRTGDLTGLIPVVKDMGVPIIALTGRDDSYLAAEASIVLDISVEKEACPLNLAPTASMVAALAMGDALAVCAMTARRFTHDDFARFHPGGTLGRASKLRVEELMRSGERLAVVPENATMREAAQEITRAQGRATLVVTDGGKLVGYVSDGDVRRLLLREDGCELPGVLVTEVMTRTPLSFHPSTMAVEALRALQERGISAAPVVDENDVAVGILDVQELLRAGLV